MFAANTGLKGVGDDGEKECQDHECVDEGDHEIIYDGECHGLRLALQGGVKHLKRRKHEWLQFSTAKVIKDKTESLKKCQSRDRKI